MTNDEIRQTICKLLSEAELDDPGGNYSSLFIRFTDPNKAQQFHDLVQLLPVGG